MTQREYAVDLICALSDSQVKAQISFISVFSDTDTAERIKQAQFDASINSKKQSLEQIKSIIKEGPLIKDEKELTRIIKGEKYGGISTE